MILPRADVVGSLLRPPELIEARDQFARGALEPAEFKKIEDRAVDQAITLQEEAGLEILTDGEIRRLSFQSQMTAAVEGFGEHTLDAFLWGKWRGDAAADDRAVARPPNLGVVAKLRRRRSLSSDEFEYLKVRTHRIAKVTLPSPSLWVNFWDPRRSSNAYPSLESFLTDVTDILRDEVRDLARLGATYIQIDAPHYALLIDSRTRSFYEGRAGGSAGLERWLDRALELDNAVMFAGGTEVTFGLHLCRGNQAGLWLAEGSYEAIAPAVFKKVRAHRLLLEYDDARSGAFDALRHVAGDKVVVLGLVSTKKPRLESRRELIGRIQEASRYVPLERLALSPQCGFASSVLGNRLTVEDQKAKLRLVTEIAHEVWA